MHLEITSESVTGFLGFTERVVTVPTLEVY